MEEKDVNFYVKKSNQVAASGCSRQLQARSCNKEHPLCLASIKCQTRFPFGVEKLLSINNKVLSNSDKQFI